MTRRLPAPPPGEPPGPLPQPPPDLEDQPDPTAEPWDDGPEEEPLLEGHVPDDPEDAPLDDPEEGALEELDPLDSSDDQDDVDTGTLDEPGLDEELVDLSAPEDHELPILTMQPRVRVDGHSLLGRIDPFAPMTVWAGAPFQGTRHVVVEVGGARVFTEVRAAAGEPEIVLGRDVLAGRFLLRL